MENEKLYQEYIQVSNQISELESKKKILTEQVMNKFKEEKLEKIEAENGLITLASRKKWVYSENVDKKNVELKELKKVEENTGVAKSETTEFLRVSLR